MMHYRSLLRLPSRALLMGLLAGATALVGCQSQSTTREILKPTAAAVAPTPAPTGLGKFSFYISGSGQGAKPFDSFRMDTNGMMTVLVTRRRPDGNFRTLRAMAEMEAKDMDTLRRMIEHGKLASLDSTDLTQNCAESEMYRLIILPLDATTHSSVTFSGCAADYNLLLEPQKRYFRLLMDWWERMRTKYRPNETE